MPTTHARTDAADADRRSLSLSNFGATASASIDALAKGASEQLARGDFAGAYALADRRCRLIVPAARDLLLRAHTHKAAGRLEAAQRDLRAALALDPTDSALDRAALSWGDDASRLEAAGRIAGRATSDWPLRRKAIAALFESGAQTADGLQRSPTGVSGWIVWGGGEPLRIEMRSGGAAQTFFVDPDPDHPLAAAGISAADVAIEVEAGGPLSLDFALAAGDVAWIEPPSRLRRSAQTPAPRRSPQVAASAPFVTIVVPVYEDYEATRACLESLCVARPAGDHRILVVDDASPNEALKAHLDAAAARGEFELLRNETNAGFAAAVNRALALRECGDALLLNADVVLSPGAIDRLQALSRSSPKIGALTPFSNNGELTSYPVRNEANPLPSALEVARLDELAKRANGDALVDIPNGIGFCLYITEACLDAVGGLPELYSHGYYEDVEFCLRARECGFRNVAAPGVYVGHAGSKSFASRKAALVMRNLQLIEARFPGYRLETAAFVTLDPLKPYREALDAASPPSGPIWLVACGPGAAEMWGGRRAERLKAQHPEATVLKMSVAARGRAIALSATGGGSPQSLTFDFGKDTAAAAFRAYLGALSVQRIELLDPASLPDEALVALIRQSGPIDLQCGDFGWFSSPAPPPDRVCATQDAPQPCDVCRGLATFGQDQAHRNERRRLKLGRALEGAERVVPLDRLAASFARRVFKSRAERWELDETPRETRAASVAISRLGVLYPHRSPAVDRLLLRLGRRLAAEGAAAELIVFGAAVDDGALMATGKVFVTGPARGEDYLDLARAYRVEGLLAPERSGGYGDLEATAAALGAPKAYFDWSFGAFAVEWGDLSLDPRICQDKAAALIAAWMNGERQS